MAQESAHCDHRRCRVLARWLPRLRLLRSLGLGGTPGCGRGTWIKQQMFLSCTNGDFQMGDLYVYIYTLWLFNIAMEKKTPFFIGKPSINWPFSMAILNNQMVYIETCLTWIPLVFFTCMGIGKQTNAKGSKRPTACQAMHRDMGCPKGP